MRIIPNEFATSAQVTSVGKSPVPYIGWPLLIIMSPVLVAYWIGLGGVVAATVAFGALKSLTIQL